MSITDYLSTLQFVILFLERKQLTGELELHRYEMQCFGLLLGKACSRWNTLASPAALITVHYLLIVLTSLPREYHSQEFIFSHFPCSCLHHIFSCISFCLSSPYPCTVTRLKFFILEQCKCELQVENGLQVALIRFETSDPSCSLYRLLQKGEEVEQSILHGT